MRLKWRSLLICLLFVYCVSASSEHGGKTALPDGFQASIPDCDASIATFSGSSFDREGKLREWKEFRVQVCELPLDFKRIPFGIMLQSQALAHGALWIRAFNDDWEVIQYKVPYTKQEFEMWDKEGEVALQQRFHVLKEGLPQLVQELPPAIQAEIFSFMAYSNGALEIMFFKNSLGTAEKVLQSVRTALGVVK